MKILLVGNGAREHIMAEKLAYSPKCEALLVFASAINPGLQTLATHYEVGEITDPAAVRTFAESHRVDFAVIGPEAPIAAGVVDELRAADIPSASPTRAMGQLETSKAFTRALLEKYHIPGNPYFRTFRSEEGLLEYAQSLGEFVVKADGLHGGKGVLVQGDHFETAEEGVEAAKHFIESDGSVVIEEKFIGQEFSLMSFVDGRSVIDMPPIQDHKRAFVGDKGPNTGGMGSYNFPLNLPFLSHQDLKDAHEITVKTAAALRQELGEDYKGVMYGGFIAVKNGVRLIEYNARLGDPEAMNALTLLETDFVDVCQAIIEGSLDQLRIRFSPRATVCKYVVPKGYPTETLKNVKIETGDLPEGVHRYLASVERRDDGLYLLGSRAIAFVAMADSVEKAEAMAQQGVESVRGPVFYREDIGTHELIQKRVDMMKALKLA